MLSISLRAQVWYVSVLLPLLPFLNLLLNMYKCLHLLKVKSGIVECIHRQFLSTSPGVFDVVLLILLVSWISTAQHAFSDTTELHSLCNIVCLLLSSMGALCILLSRNADE